MEGAGWRDATCVLRRRRRLRIRTDNSSWAAAAAAAAVGRAVHVLVRPLQQFRQRTGACARRINNYCRSHYPKPVWACFVCQLAGWADSGAQARLRAHLSHGSHRPVTGDHSPPVRAEPAADLVQPGSLGTAADIAERNRLCDEQAAPAWPRNWKQNPETGAGYWRCC